MLNIDFTEHFDRLNTFNVFCKHCKRKYNYIGNNELLKHLIMKHITSLRLADDRDGNVTNISCKDVWRCFTKLSGNKVAICKYCDKMLSFKTTISNLKAHLARRHSEEFYRILLNLTPTEFVDNASPDDDEVSNDSSQDSFDVWKYFEQETGGRARCVVCRASCPNSTEELKNHLKENHPKIINGDQDEEDSDDQENEGNYTEVIYLEEDTKKKTPTKYYIKETKPKTEPKKPKKIEKPVARRLSTSSDDMPIKRRKVDTSNELDTFLTYIKCLLSQVPSEVFTKLQLDIVNLIMKAKMSQSSTETVLESSANVTGEANIDRSDVISVALADADIAPITVPYYVKENFHTDYQGSLRRLEMTIEEEYILGLRHACQRERNYRDSMAWKARNFGDSRQYAEAQKLRTPSCEKLQQFQR